VGAQAREEGECRLLREEMSRVDPGQPHQARLAPTCSVVLVKRVRRG
jgi:hypothetical protein